MIDAKAKIRGNNPYMIPRELSQDDPSQQFGHR